VTDWNRYDVCTNPDFSCPAGPGEPCVGVRGGALANPHRGRPKLKVPVDPPLVADDETAWSEVENATVADDYVRDQVQLDNAQAWPSNPAGRRADREVPKDHPRDRWKRPLIMSAVLGPDGIWTVPVGADGNLVVDLVGYTRASSLGNAIENSEGLSRWRTGMVVFGMSRRKDLTLAAQAIPGTEDKKLHRAPLYAIADKALEAAEASSAATTGTALHSLTEQADVGTLTVDIGEYQGVLDAYLEAMTGWRIVRSETFVVSDHFAAAGTFDRLITPLEPMALVDQDTGEIITVIMPGDLVVVDLKTSSTADYFGAKFFAQLAVYVTGQLYDRETGRRTPLGQRTDFGLILHIPQGGDPDTGEPVARWHWVDMRAGMALAQLACVVMESRKKRFTRTHMIEVLAVPYDGPDPGTIAAQPGGPTAVPAIAPARDPLGDRHLADAASIVAATASFPEAAADLIDAQLVDDGGEPETRSAPAAALEAVNAARGAVREWMAEHAGQTIGETMDAERRAADQLGAQGGDYDLDAPDPGGPHKGDDYDAERTAVPGPEETAPLPAGWESHREQAEGAGPAADEIAAESMVDTGGVPTDRSRTTVVDPPENLAGHLQEAAKRRAIEDALIKKIRGAVALTGSPASLLGLHDRAKSAGYLSDRVKRALGERKAQLVAAARTTTTGD
jgi:hypothetical protein